MDDFPNNIKTHMRKQYLRISDDMRKQILEYYTNDENVYTYPGRRDYVIIYDEKGGKTKVQKQLLLYTIHDLYLKFKNEYEGNEELPSFSYFYSLHPEQCIHTGDPGSRNICVCGQHQNVKLKLLALSRKLNYRNLLVGAVCNVDNEDCMIKRCPNCPRESGVNEKFKAIVEELDIELKEGKIKYSKWIHQGSAAALEKFEEESDILISEVCEDISNLTKHHFVADSQKNYLNYCKKKLESDTCCDTEETAELQNVNFCEISDTKDHFAYIVNAFTSELMAFIKREFSWAKNIIYFSDGAPTQYKYKNHLANIFFHEKDFGIAVKSYNFFATSHGKSPCDALGGTVKRMVMQHCIRFFPQDQITNAHEMYEYALENIENIRALWVPNEIVKRFEKKLKNRFASTKTFPDTKTNHSYIPCEEKSMKMKITSFLVEEKIIQLKLDE
ncbi:hypothetical protein TKK_0010152 [Trichogramma kaykai]